MEASKILVARRPGGVLIKVMGRGTFENAGCLKSLYQQSLQEGVNRFVLDLGECSELDSTFLGILLGLGLKLKEVDGGLLHVHNANPRNRELLKSLGVDRLIQLGGAKE